MRVLVAVGVAVAIASLCGSAGAQRIETGDAGLSLRIEPPAELHVGAAAGIEVFLKLEGKGQPLLLTPSAEGEAVRVVRGRLLRADAQRTPQGELRFVVPIVARRAGAAAFRVEVMTYRCDAACVPLRVSASRLLQVAGS